MIHPSIPVALLALAAPVTIGAGELPGPRSAPLDGTVLAQVSIHERIIIRVPRMMAQPLRATPRAAAPIAWKEHKGPKCVAAAAIAGATVGKPGSVDLLLSDGARLRAKLDGDCAPIDYYSGFYIKPDSDGMICHDRDVIRLRSGGSCEIDNFKTLRPGRK